jgi:hypothetical protein
MSMARGGTTKLNDVGVVSASDTTILGQEKTFVDLNYAASTSSFKQQLSGHSIKAKLVVNGDSGAIAAGATLKWDTTEGVGTHVVVAGDEDKLAGFVNAYVGSAGVPVGSTFWMITSGPTKVAYGSGTVTAGVRLASAGSARVKTIDTSSAADVAAQCGVALEEMTVAGTLYRALVDVQGY